MLGVRRRLGLRSRTGLVRHMRRGPVLVGRSRLVQEVRRRSDGTCSDGKGTECAVVTSVRRHLRRLLSPNSNVMLIGKIVRPAPTSAPSAGPSAAPTGSPAPTVSAVPSTSPTQDPTHAPTATFSPTRSETYAPTRAMTDAPSYAPTTDTYAPSSTPTATAAPSSMPSARSAPTK